MDALLQYLAAIKDGLYELHTRSGVRDECSQILANLRTAADQAHDSATQAATVSAVVAPATPDDLGAVLVGIRDDVAALKAAWLHPADTVDAKVAG